MTEIDFTPTPFLYVTVGFVIGMTLGWIIGFFDSNSRSAKKIEAAESKADIALRESEKKTAQAEQKLALASQLAAGPQDDPGLLRLKNNDGRILLEMDGSPIASPLSSDKKKRLIELVTVLRPWIEGGQPPQAVSQPAAPVQSPPVPAPVQTTVSYPGQPAAPVTPAGKKPEAEKSITSMSIVNQIDTVLQARLVDSPLAKRGIRLQESIQGGVEVYVGLEKFSTIDDVTDDVIKTAIRAAIAEWENKYTPGL